MSSNPIKSFRGFLQQETLPSMISTGLFQERIYARFTLLEFLYQTKMNYRYYKQANSLAFTSPTCKPMSY